MQNLADSEHLLYELYRALVEKQDFKRIQQVSLKQHKLAFPNSTFAIHKSPLERAIAAMLLQAQHMLQSPDSKAQVAMLLQLADRYANQEPSDVGSFWIRAKLLELQVKADPFKYRSTSESDGLFQI